MTAARDDMIGDTNILPVKCPGCGEAQNTLDGAADPFAADATVGCMVCGHIFGADEYRTLLAERQREFQTLQVGSK